MAPACITGIRCAGRPRDAPNAGAPNGSLDPPGPAAVPKLLLLFNGAATPSCAEAGRVNNTAAADEMPQPRQSAATSHEREDDVVGEPLSCERELKCELQPLC